jgi:exonuclease III
MKLICLNVDGGKKGLRLLDYISKNSNNTDVFCFQEVFNNGKKITEFQKDADMDIFSKIEKVLPRHKGFFNCGETTDEGSGIFISDSLDIKETGFEYIHKWSKEVYGEDTFPIDRILQYALLNIDDRDFLIVNVHGLWEKSGRGDTPIRFEQMKILKQFLSKYNCTKIVCGDFNIKSDTKAISSMTSDFRNLTKEFGVEKSISEEDKEAVDYIFVPPEVEVVDFQGPDIKVSDHRPLELEFELRG